jgi:hypothetical protein
LRDYHAEESGMAEWPVEQVFEKNAEWMLRMHAKDFT